MEKAELEFEWHLNSAQAKAEAESVERAVSGIGDSAEASEQRVQANVRKTTANQREQIGIIERLKQKMAELRETQEKATSTTGIEKANIKIQEFQKEIDRLNKIGKQGFDDMGKAIPDFSRPVGTINRMQEAMKLYAKASKEATNPEIIAKYNKKLEETQKEINKLGNAGKSGFDDAGNKLAQANNQGGGLLSTIKNIGGAVGIAFAGSTLINFGKELFGIANQASGIERAFSAIGGDGALDKLRAETKGFVTDLELEKLTVQAKNLNVPIDNLGTFFAFAAQRAKDTGADVQQLTNDIINGLGRESPRVIDNLGISQKELNKEIAKTGDFSQAVANIMARSMNEAGVAVDTLADKTNRLSTWWDNLKKSASGFFSKLADPGLADNAIIGNLTEAQMNKFAGFSKQADDVRAQSIIKQKREIAQLSAQYQAVTKRVENFNSATAGGSKTELQKGQKNIGERLAAAQNVLKQLNEIDRKTEVTARQNKGVYNINELDEKIDKLTIKFKDSLDPKERANLKKQIDEATKLRDQMEGKKDKAKTTTRGQSDDTQLRQQESLQQKLTDLRNEYNRKSMDSDEAEVQAVRDKFAKMADEVARFNKKAKPQFRVDASGLDKLRDQAIADLQYKQETVKLGASLDHQKQLYKEFEEYKTQFGEAEAKKRYQNQIDVDSTYKAQVAKQLGLSLAQSAVNPTASVNARNTSLGNRYAEADNADRDSYEKLLAETMSYEQKRTVMVETYNAKRKQLEQAGNIDAITVLDTIHKEALGKLDDENTQKLDAFKKLFLGIEELSDGAAKKVIADAQSMLAKLVASGAISAEMAKQIAGKLKESQKALEDRLPKRLQQLGGELKNIAGLVDDVDFGQWLGSIADVVGGIGQMKGQINELKNLKKGDTLGAISGGLGVLGSAIGIGQTIVGLFNAGAEKRNRQLQEQESLRQEAYKKSNEAITKSFERQLKLINEIYGVGKIEKYKSTIDELNKSQADLAGKINKSISLPAGADKLMKDYIKALNEGSNTSPYKLLGFDEAIAFLMKQGLVLKLDTSNVEQLQSLLDKGGLDEKTASNVQAYLDGLAKITEANNALREQLTGTSFTEIADSIVDAVTSGAESAGQNFEDIMRKAMLNSLKSPALTKSIQDWYEEFYKAAEDGLTGDEVNDLRTKYQDIAKQADADKKKLEQATGISFDSSSSSNSNPNTIRGSVTNITAQQADVLSGNIAGMRLELSATNKVLQANSATGLAEMRQQTLTQMQIEANTKRTADNTDRLLSIEASLKSMDGKMSNASNALAARGGI